MSLEHTVIQQNDLHTFNQALQPLETADATSRRPTATEVQQASFSGIKTAQETLDKNFANVELVGQSGKSQQGDKPISFVALAESAAHGELTDTLKKAGVDVNDQKALDDYMAKSFLTSMVDSMRSQGIDIPAGADGKVSDAELGKAVFKQLLETPETGPDPLAELRTALAKDPVSGVEMMRRHVLEDLNTFLRQEKESKGGQ